MEWLWKIFLAIVALPFFFMGLSMILQLVFGSGVGLLAFFAMIWDKQERLTAKQGLAFGSIYVLLQMLLVFVVALFVSFICNFPGITDAFNFILSLVPIGVLIASLIRGKYAFGLAFFLVNQILVMLLRLL